MRRFRGARGYEKAAAIASGVRIRGNGPNLNVIIGVAWHFGDIAVEGPIGAGKTVLAERLGTRLDATIVLEEMDNPFLADFDADRACASTAGPAVHSQPAPAADHASTDGSLQPDHGLRSPLRQGTDLRLLEPRRQRVVDLPAALRSAVARRAPPGFVGVYLQALTEALLCRLRARPADPDGILP